VAQSIAFACPLSLKATRICVELRLDASLIFACRRHIAFVGDRRPSSRYSPLALPRQRRQRFILTIRASDAWLQGHSYREIAEGLFGKEQVMGRSWRGMICVPSYPPGPDGLAMMRGGYRALLRPPLRKK